MSVVEQTEKRKAGRPKKVQAPTPTQASLDNPRELKLQLQREVYLESYYEFFKAAFPHVKGDSYEEMKHVEMICNRLEVIGLRLARGQKREFHQDVNVPPRSLKSFVISIVFPIWVWLHKPNAEILSVSNSDSLAQAQMGFSKAIINSPWFQELFGHVFTIVKDNEDTITTNKGGKREAFGIKSKSIGKNADLILCDDIMDSDTANSDTERLTALKKFRESIFTRLNKRDVGVIINIQQRLHTEDLSGWLEKNLGAYFQKIKLPSEVTGPHQMEPQSWFPYVYTPEADTTGSYLLCDKPGYFSRDDLTQAYQVLTAHGYAQQHLQTPRSREGGLIKEVFLRQNTITREAFRQLVSGKSPEYQLWLDGAETTNPKRDPTAIILTAVVDRQIYVLDVQWKRLVFPDLVEYLKAYLSNNRHSLYPISRFWIEGKSIGKSLIAQLRKDVSDLVIREVQPGKGKALRLIPLLGWFEGHRVHILQDTFTDSFIEECCSFTDGKGQNHDDALDCLIYAIQNAKESGFFWAAVN